MRNAHHIRPTGLLNPNLLSEVVIVSSVPVVVLGLLLILVAAIR
jgi:hypothetical protein